MLLINAMAHLPLPENPPEVSAGGTGTWQGSMSGGPSGRPCAVPPSRYLLAQKHTED